MSALSAAAGTENDPARDRRDRVLELVERYALVAREGERVIEHGTLPVTRDEPLRREIEQFLECVRTRREPLVTGADGRRALMLALRIVRAADAGRT